MGKCYLCKTNITKDNAASADWSGNLQNLCKQCSTILSCSRYAKKHFKSKEKTIEDINKYKRLVEIHTMVLAAAEIEEVTGTTITPRKIADEVVRRLSHENKGDNNNVTTTNKTR